MDSKDVMQAISEKDNKSEFKLFCDKLISRLECYYGDNYSVTISPVNKNNGIIRHALLIREDGCNITPSIYIDSYYEEYRDGVSFAEVIRTIIDIRNSNDIMPEFDIEFIRDYEAVKRKLGMKLISKELNGKLLDTVPYAEFADLAVVFFIMVPEYKDGEASILIRDELFKEWDVSVSKLFDDAKENMMRVYPPLRMNMVDVVMNMIREKNDRDNNDDISKFIDNMKDEMSGTDMYVLTNQAKWYGASCMVYDNMLSCLADSFEADYYVLPSSIHEVILIPDRGEEYSKSSLTNMVKEVNASEINDDEILSDHAYKYHRANHWLESLL